MSDIILPYSEIYIDKLFYEWYKAGRPKLQSNSKKSLMNIIPPDESGRKPNRETVRKWMNEHGWHERADALDAKMSMQLDNEAIKQKSDLYKEISDIGKDTMLRGYKFIEENGFDSSAAALRAIFGGADLVAKFGNAAEILVSIGAMSDDQVRREIERLSRMSDDEIINAEEVETEDEEEDAETDNS